VTTTTKLPDATRMGAVEVNVLDVERELRFYEGLLGLKRRGTRGDVTDLGLVRLRHTPDAPPRTRGASGLYHMAILVPTRPDLGRAIAHLVRARYPLEGASDHLVSEALYLSDPEGNGIEIYRDRPRDEWRWANGTLHMATEPMDVEGVLSSAGETSWAGMPDGTTMLIDAGALHRNTPFVIDEKPDSLYSAINICSDRCVLWRLWCAILSLMPNSIPCPICW